MKIGPLYHYGSYATINLDAYKNTRYRFHTTMVLTQHGNSRVINLLVSDVSIPLWFLRNVCQMHEENIRP